MKTRWIAAAFLVTALSACGSSKTATSTGTTGTTGNGGDSASTSSSSGGGAGTGGTGGATTTTTTATSSTTTTTTTTGAGGAAELDAGLAGWTLTWSDEFNGPDGSGIDTTKWAAQTGGTGWGNQEREYYTSSLTNVQQSGGNLVITATTEGAAAQTCWYGQCQYTSARIQTMGLFSQEYGRFEARIKIPAGQGMWPAFWMLGNNIDTASWPACGEVDIMENIGKEPSIVHGSMHGPGYSGANDPTAAYTLPANGVYADDFHVFAVEWAPGTVSFYVDSALYETVTSATIPAGDTWVFDQPFFLLLNVAVGGSWPGDPDATTVFPQTMLVDYVRVYSMN